MFTVYDVMKMNNGLPVLVCDLFRDEEITDKLITDIGNFKKGEFVPGQIRYCFSEPKTRTIMLRTTKDCSKIKTVQFE